MALSMTDNKISDEDRKLLDLIHNDPGLIAHYRKRGPRFETLVLWGILTAFQIVAILGIIFGLFMLIATRGSEDLSEPQTAMTIFFTSIGVLLAALIIKWHARPAYEAVQSTGCRSQTLKSGAMI